MLYVPIMDQQVPNWNKIVSLRNISEEHFNSYDMGK